MSETCELAIPDGWQLVPKEPIEAHYGVPYDTGMGTSTGMWEMLSDVLCEHREKLPEPLNNAIYALRDGDAFISPRENNSKKGT